MSRSTFISLIREICSELGIECETYSMDWIIKLGNGSSVSYIYGYNFDINGSAATQISCDKSATFLCLSAHRVPAVPHIAFMNPNNSQVFDYVDKMGTLTAIHAFAKQHEYNLVLKPLRGTGGNDVFHTQSGKELEAAVLYLFERDYALSVSPYIEIFEEFRVVILRGDARLVYRKVRPAVLGDGYRNVQQLVAALLLDKRTPHMNLIQGLAGLSGKELEFVPPSKTLFPIEWKHNLGKGARPELVPVESPIYQELVHLAKEAATAINICFCSVDIIQTENGFCVLEVNAGVMMDSFVASSANKGIAKQIYMDAIKR